jgi:DNA-binding response OmpR family regulator
MPAESSIILVSDDDNIINVLKPKLILLREIDNILSTNYKEALEDIKNKNILPETILIYCGAKKQECLNLIQNIKTDESTKKTSILLIIPKYDQDFVLSAYDEDITDYLILNPDSAEILMRTIWCLKKNANMKIIDKQNILLQELGVMDKSSGFYTNEYCEKILKMELKRLNESNTEGLLILISANEESKFELNSAKLAKAIKTSIRNSDLVVQGLANRFYILLEDTKLKGAFCVWEKIKRALGEQYKVIAGIASIGDKTFDDLKNELFAAIIEAVSTNQDVVIVNQKNLTLTTDWAEKISSPQKNFKLFKQAFNKKLEKVIAPIFFQFQKLYEEKLFDTKIEQYSNSALSAFILKRANQVSELRITYPGFSKINIDILHQGLDSPENKRISLDLSELDDSKLTEILKNFINDFKNN